jgi:hypothetical protein
MLIRACDLRMAIKGWLEKYGASNTLLCKIHLTSVEWDHVRYLIVLLQPYFQWTEGLSKATTLIIGKAWATYTGLFKHLETYSNLLQKKMTPWKSGLADAVTAAHSKLAEYTKTDGHRGTIYNLACILDPMQKLELYKSFAFKSHYVATYAREVRSFYDDEYAHLEAERPSSPQRPKAAETDFISLAMAQHNASKGSRGQPSELDKYLQSETTTDRDLLGFWRAYESRAPGLSQMAKNVHAAVVATVEAERLFSVGRLVCPYQRNRLDQSTVMQLMMVRQHQKLLSRLGGGGKRSVVGQKRKYQFAQEDYDDAANLAISDDDMESDSEDGPPVILARSRRPPKNKSRRSGH